MGRRKVPRKKSTLNNIETKVFNILRSLKVKIIPNAMVDKYSVDFLVNDKYIIECYGDFWHCNPLKYAADFFNRGKKKMARDIWKRDALRRATFEKLGYNVLELWESEINGGAKAINRKIKQLLKGASDGY